MLRFSAPDIISGFTIDGCAGFDFGVAFCMPTLALTRDADAQAKRD